MPMLPDGTVVARRFRIVAALGAGPHGVVYRAAETAGGREVALKIIEVDDDGRATALIAAATRAEAVVHAAVARTLAAGREERAVWIASELAPGRSLAAALEDGERLDGEATVALVRALCGGLAALHAAGLLHGDLKPENVVLAPDGAARLTDVALARSGGRRAGAYLSPEAAHGDREDERSDLYALGVLAVQALGGSGGALEEALALPDDAPMALRRVIIRLLHKDRGARFRHAVDVVEALDGRAPARPRHARHLGLALVAAGALALVAFLWLRG
jgi:serine/threonine-protein kinase